MRTVANRLSCERVLITQGMQGCLCYSWDEGFCRVPALTGRVVDRVGAGDAVLAITALCAAQKAPMEVLGLIGSSVGAQAVGIVGNRTSIDSVALARSIECLLKSCSFAEDDGFSVSPPTFVRQPPNRDLIGIAKAHSIEACGETGTTSRRFAISRQARAAGAQR